MLAQLHPQLAVRVQTELWASGTCCELQVHWCPQSRLAEGEVAEETRRGGRGRKRKKLQLCQNLESLTWQLGNNPHGFQNPMVKFMAQRQRPQHMSADLRGMLEAWKRWNQLRNLMALDDPKKKWEVKSYWNRRKCVSIFLKVLLICYFIEIIHPIDGLQPLASTCQDLWHIHFGMNQWRVIFTFSSPKDLNDSVNIFVGQKRVWLNIKWLPIACRYPKSQDC